MHAAAPGNRRALHAGHSIGEAEGRTGPIRFAAEGGGFFAATPRGAGAPLGSLVGASLAAAVAATGSRAGAARTAKTFWQRGQRMLPPAPSGIFSSRLQC